MSSLKELVKLKRELDQRMKTEGKKAIETAIAELFGQHPIIKGIKWAQFTPYYSDGDSCTFGVNELQVAFDPTVVAEKIGEEYDEKERLPSLNLPSDYNDGWYYLFSGKSKKVSDEINEALSAIEAFSTEIYQLQSVLGYVFGDHVEVIVTPNKIVTQEYEHD